MSNAQWLAPLKTQSELKINAIGWPTRKDEAWSLTDLKPWLKVKYTSPPLATSKFALTDELTQLIVGFDSALLFYNGVFQSELSTAKQNSNLVVQPISSSEKFSTEIKSFILEQFSHQPSENLKAFGYQNQSQYRDGAYVEVNASEKTQKIAMVFISDRESDSIDSEPFVECNKNLICIKKNAQSEILELYLSTNNFEFLNNSATKYLLEEGSVTHVSQFSKYGEEGLFLLDTEFILKKNAQLQLAQISKGGRASRFETYIDLLEENANVEYQTLGLGKKNSSHDFSSSIRHTKGQTKSRQTALGIYSEQSSGLFSGHLYIAKDAQKSDAKQTSKNVIVGDEAQASAKPQLEVFADDVKAAHGATVGQIRDDEIFYLMSRGIDRETAMNLLTQGLAWSVVSHLSPWLKEKIRESVWKL
jgi:Fe-S cluster assembly protein SufD